MKAFLLLLSLLLLPQANAAEIEEYLYYRDVNVPSFQTLREFFDLPDRTGNYEITLVSDSLGPLTFQVFRVHEEEEVSVKRTRSYKVRDHEFHMPFNNPQGANDLIVQISNTNPAASALVSVFVVELP